MAVDENKIKKIQDRYLELPEDVQKALFSTKTSDAIFEVGKKHGLVIEKMGELADETGLVMLGMTKPSEYIRNLEKRLEIEATKAKEIAEDINQKVFSPIRESLKKIHGIIPSPPATPIPPPENLPVEITPPPPPAGGPPPLTVRGGGEGGGVTPFPITKGEGSGVRGQEADGVTEKVNQILKNHEAIKQARKHVMPPQPEDVKVGEIARPIEPKVDVKPMMGGRIDTKITPPPPPAGGPPPLTVRGGGEGGGVTKEIPNIFVRNIPAESPPHNQAGKEAKNLLEKAANDPYKEPIE